MWWDFKNSDTRAKLTTMNGTEWNLTRFSAKINDIVKDFPLTDFLCVTDMLQNEIDGLNGGVRAASFRFEPNPTDSALINAIETVCGFFSRAFVKDGANYEDVRLVIGYALLSNEGRDWLYCPQAVICDYDKGVVLHYLLFTEVDENSEPRYIINAFKGVETGAKEISIPRRVFRKKTVTTTELQKAGYDIGNAVIDDVFCKVHRSSLEYYLSLEGNDFANGAVALNGEQTAALLKLLHEDKFRNLKGKYVRVARSFRDGIVCIGDIIDDKKWVERFDFGFVSENS